MDLEVRESLRDILSLRLRILRMRRTLLAQQIRRQIRRRRWYQRPLNVRRDQYGEFSRIVQRMRDGDPEKYFEYFRMYKPTFGEIFAAVRQRIDHSRHHRSPVSAEERLALTLRSISFSLSSSVQEEARGIFGIQHQKLRNVRTRVKMKNVNK